MRNTEAQRRGVTWPGSHQLKNGRTRTQPKFLEEKSGPPPHPPLWYDTAAFYQKICRGLWSLCLPLWAVLFPAYQLSATTLTGVPNTPILSPASDTPSMEDFFFFPQEVVLWRNTKEQSSSCRGECRSKERVLEGEQMHELKGITWKRRGGAGERKSRWEEMSIKVRLQRLAFNGLRVESSVITGGEKKQLQ